MAAGLLDDPLSITRIARLESLADPGPATSSDSLPITRFGAYAECDEDKWPYGMCTLKVITHTDSPPVLIAGKLPTCFKLPTPPAPGCQGATQCSSLL